MNIGSGMNIPDPQHCLWVSKASSLRVEKDKEAIRGITISPNYTTVMGLVAM
jgi:hypothetical protein